MQQRQTPPTDQTLSQVPDQNPDQTMAQPTDQTSDQTTGHPQAESAPEGQAQPSRISYLDGIRFRRVVRAAARRLIEKHGHLNAINVFPVPDGDTGSNMAGTMKSIVASTSATPESSIGRMSSIVAESALMGARGNSGVILAQFLAGFSEGVKDLSRVSPRDFAEAASLAARRAVEAIAHPKEGTILTVIRDWAEHLRENCHSYKDFHHLLHDSLDRARQSVQETREKLAALKAADVVDAGGLGFVYLLEGIAEFTERGTINRRGKTDGQSGTTGTAGTPGEADSADNATLGEAQERVAVEDLTYGYCTECLIRSEATSPVDREELRVRLEELGDSIVVAGAGAVTRVHVHTDTPDTVFAIAAEYGEVSHHKAEDMLRQHRDLLAAMAGGHPQAAPAPTGTAVVTDSTCDLPRELLDQYAIRTVPLRLFLDDEEFVDKVSISADEFNRRLPSSRSARTSQPAPADFRTVYEEVLATHAQVASLHVTAMYSGTHQSAATVARMVSPHIAAVDCRTLTVGLGLVVLEAARRAQTGMDAAEVARLAARDADNLHVYVSMDTLDFAVRGGRMSRGTGMVAKLLHIKPVVCFDPRKGGKVDVAAKGIGPRRAGEKLFALLERAAANLDNPRFAVAHVGAPDTAARYAKELEARFGVAPLYVMPASPVLGCHSGPGACAVALLGDPKEG
ncbi:DegV family protein [Nitratidesulfovibrio sp. SRB-5]|uniref:DegV family protein n=1 Tax=Nitratidesulfovibrio sp. SRB-5 TaxID=2872636 RepID=UPI001027E118|nr:DegV family protein [Nitratidesulfovibrio sp. SRB-5]RXF77714.1 DegV family EDD domain-containing protein [Desulfovibrio sp. DS-1]